MSSICASLSLPPTHPGLSNTGAALQLWKSASAVFSNPTALLSLTRNFQILDQDGSLNWGNVAFVTTCIIAMAGCGFLSSLLRRKGSKRSSGRKRFRRGIQIHDSKTSPETTTSSEEEDYDSSGSLRNGTDAALPQEKVTHKHHEQSADALATDPGILKKRSSYHSYSTSIATYPSIRTFFSPHPHMDKLPTKPTPIPLLVFVHGLGGSLAQFSFFTNEFS